MGYNFLIPGRGSSQHIDRGALSVASRRGASYYYSDVYGQPLPPEGGADRKNPNSNKKPLEAADRAPRSTVSTEVPE